MNAFDRLNRSLGKLPDRVGDAVTVNGQPLRGLFHEPDRQDAVALDFVRGEPRREATLQLAIASLVGLLVEVGDMVEAVGERWTVVPPIINTGNGFITLNLEHLP